MNNLFFAVSFLLGLRNVNQENYPIKSIEVNPNYYLVSGPYQGLDSLSVSDSLTLVRVNNSRIKEIWINSSDNSNEPLFYLAAREGDSLLDCHSFYFKDNFLAKKRCENWSFSVVNHYAEEHNVFFDYEKRTVLFTSNNYFSNKIDTAAIITWW